MDVISVDYSSDEAPLKFTTSLRQTGFGVVRGHPIARELIDQVYADWQRFFSDERKSQFLYDPKAHAQEGYFSQSISEVAKGFDKKDLKEFYQYYPWGRYPEFLGEATKTLYRQMNELAIVLLGWIEQNTPAEIRAHFSVPLGEMVKDCPRTMLRVLHYPPLAGNEPEGAVRANAHTDINLITLLPASTAMGLQARKANGEWYDVPCDYGSIVVNVADMLQMCSQHYYPSTVHRVVNPTGAAARQSRMSLPLFLHAHPEVRLSETHTADEYLAERLRELRVLA